jgi:hypothetical protein
MWRPSPDRLAQFERLPDDLADPPARQIIALGDRLAAPSAQRALHDPMPADFPLDRADAGGGRGCGCCRVGHGGAPVAAM